MKRCAFVVMPWHSLHYPCLAAGILTAVAAERCAQWSVNQIYANVEWAEYLFAKSEGLITPNDYAAIGEELFLESAGEWVFAPALHGTEEWGVSEYRAKANLSEEAFALALWAHRSSPGFVDRLARRIVDGGYDLLALTSTFMQNVPALALAKRVKELNSDIVTIMGGGNCDGEQGVALHRNFQFVDFVVRGDGELPFAKFLDALAGSGSFADVPALVWRKGTAQNVNPTDSAVEMIDVPAPSYGAFFAQLNDVAIAAFVDPQLVMESARGCWWGEKHHCTFCGLNGSGMRFRSKNPDRVLSEIESLVSTHRVLDVIVADNIMDSRYFKSLLPKLAEKDWDLRVHYEVKSNLRDEQLQLLSECGVRHIQPGIESLSGRLLQLMQKGVTGARNVQVLRDCEERNLTVSWNYLYGFPGETPQDYLSIISQLPNLHHLQPPNSAARIVLERFSPFFTDPSLGFAERSPSRLYSLIYGLNDDSLQDMVYLFDSRAQGIGGEVEEALLGAVAKWRSAYAAGSELVAVDDGEVVLVTDRRDNRGERFLLEDPLEVALFRTLRIPRRLTRLREDLGRNGLAAAEHLIFDAIARLVERGLTYQDDGWIVGVCNPPIPFKLRMPRT